MEKNGVQNRGILCYRDFPLGCGTISNNSPLTQSTHSYTRDYPPGFCPTPSKRSTNEPENRSKTEKDCGYFSSSSTWRRSVSAIKTKPSKMEDKGKKPMKFGEREKVLEMLRLFRERCDYISMNDKSVKRVDVKADCELKQECKIIHLSALLIGNVPGVEIGDKFYYRVELMIVGLHRRPQGGIDYMQIGNDKIATCIVANERHLDKINHPDVLTYIGEGGVLPRGKIGIPPDQQLKGGNLALYNSNKQRSVVRVVKGLNCDGQKIVYVYDGLYEVMKCENKKGDKGNMIYEFELVRCPGQQPVDWKKHRRIVF